MIGEQHERLIERRLGARGLASAEGDEQRAGDRGLGERGLGAARARGEGRERGEAADQGAGAGQLGFFGGGET